MQFDFSLLAGGGQIIDASGKFFKYKSGTGAIRVTTNKGGYIDLLPGQGVWNADFSTLTVRDMSGAANSGVLLAGAFDFHDDRISGAVEVIDGGRNRSKAGFAFSGYIGISAGAGQYANVQLWNKSANKNLVVESIVISSPDATPSVQIKHHNLALTNLGGFAAGCKKVGGAASVAAEMRNELAAAIRGSDLLFAINLQQGSPYTLVPKEPIIIPPQYGIVVANGYTAGTVNADFEFFEEQM